MNNKPSQQEGRQYLHRTMGGEGGSKGRFQMYTAIVNVDIRIVKPPNNENPSILDDTSIEKVFPLL